MTNIRWPEENKSHYGDFGVRPPVKVADCNNLIGRNA